TLPHMAAVKHHSYTIAPRLFSNPLSKVFWILSVIMIGFHLAVLFRVPIPKLWRIETRYTYLWLSSVFGLGLVTLFLTWKEQVAWWTEGQGFSLKRSAPHLVLALLASIWVGTHVPPKYRMLADEQSHLSVAQAFYHYGRAERCVEAHYFDRSLHCEKFENEIRPKTYPLTLSFIYSFLGENLRWTFWFNFALYLLVGFILARITREATALTGAALFTQAAWYLWPLNAWWARAAGYEMTYCFWLSLCFATSLAYGQILAGDHFADGSQKVKMLSLQIFLAVVAALAIQTRPDALLSVGITLLPAVAPLLLDAKAESRTRGGLFAAILLAAIYPWSMLRGALREWDMDVIPKGAPPFSLDAFSRNIYPNLDVVMNLSGDWPSSQTLVLFGLAGVFVGLFGFTANKRLRLVTVTTTLWLAAVFGVFTAFQHGRMNIAVSMRYATCLYPALSVLAGVTGASILRRFAQHHWGAGLLVAVCIILMISHAPVIED
ncbi:MAG: hypothetical protein AAB425_12745, partial [Bdellovibrionota bacterium]